MKKTVSLKENHLFRRTYSRGKTAADSRLALYVRGNGQRENRLGLTVSTKVGHAVVRNRVRRRLREIYRLHEEQVLGGRDVVVVARVRWYRRDISPYRDPCCRFIPTCSTYALEAVEVHGAVKGGLLAVWRVLRCHPFHREKSFIYDPVPPKKIKRI